MAHLLHGYVLALASVPTLVSMFKELELARLLLVKAEVETLHEHRLAHRDSRRARFSECHEAHQGARKAEPSGHVTSAVQRALDVDVSARYAANSLVMDS